MGFKQEKGRKRYTVGFEFITALSPYFAVGVLSALHAHSLRHLGVLSVVVLNVGRARGGLELVAGLVVNATHDFIAGRHRCHFSEALANDVLTGGSWNVALVTYDTNGASSSLVPRLCFCEQVELCIATVHLPGMCFLLMSLAGAAS